MVRTDFSMHRTGCWTCLVNDLHGKHTRGVNQFQLINHHAHLLATQAPHPPYILCRLDTGPMLASIGPVSSRHEMLDDGAHTLSGCRATSPKENSRVSSSSNVDYNSLSDHHTFKSSPYTKHSHPHPRTHTHTADLS